MKKVIIIGNGFDIAHNYKTSYSEFVNKYRERNEIKKFGDKMSEIPSNSTMNTWYGFENDLRRYSEYIWGEHINKDVDYFDTKCNKMNQIFTSISDLLYEYLSDITKNDNGIRFRNVKKYLSGENIVITYNYTKVAENYGIKPYYINGSLTEKYIILGFDNEVEFDLGGNVILRNEKQRHRLVLDFRRFLSDRINELVSEEVLRILELFERQSYWFAGLRNEFTEECDQYKDLFLYKYFDEYRKNYAEKRRFYCSYDAPSDYELVIMGHGLKSDQSDLCELIKGATHITIFTYDGESNEDRDEKEKYIHSINIDAQIAYERYV